MARDWYRLPVDVAGFIALKSETYEDFISFSSVCRSWNRASSLKKPLWKPKMPLPCLLFSENRHDNPNFVRKLYNTSSSEFYQLKLPQMFGKRCWGSTHGWVAMVGNDLNVELFNPITKDRISFPSFEAIFKVYKDGFLGDIGDDSLEEEFMYCCLNKLVVIKVSQGDLHEFVIIVLYDYNKSAAFAWHGDRTWTSITVKENARMVGVLVKGDEVFALNDDGSMVYWNVKEFCCREIVNPIDYCPPAKRKTSKALRALNGEKSIYLIQSGHDFLMVLRYKEDSIDNPELNKQSDDPDDSFYETIGIRVFMLDKKHENWEEIEDLDNVALFIGENYSLSVALSLDKCLKRNCIYFTDDMADYWLTSPKAVGLDMGIYDNKSGGSWPLYDSDKLRPSFPPPIWFVPQF